MTFERHKSTLIPTVEFSGDGTILFTNPNGSFSMPRRQKDAEEELASSELTIFHLSPGSQPGSYCQNQDSNNNQRKYKQRGSGSLRSLNPQSPSGGTASTASSSLLRRLRQSKYAQSAEIDEKWYSLSSARGFSIDSTGTHKSQKSKKIARRGTWSSSERSYNSKRQDSPQNVNSLKGRFSGGKPRLTPEVAASLELERVASNSPKGSVSSHSGSGLERSQNLNTLYGRFSQGTRLNLVEQPARKRRFTDEQLPYVVFLIIGPLLIAVGIIRLIISIWNAFGTGVWAGVLILSLGIVGRLHGGNYTSNLWNSLYISLGVLSSVCVMVAAGFNLSVLVPMIYQVILSRDATLDARVRANVLFSNNFNHTLPYVNVQNQVMLTLILDFITLALLAIGFFCQTATVIAIDNYWGTNFDLTGDCDHRGIPRFFNPLEQMSVGQAAIFVGLVETTMIDYISPNIDSAPTNIPHGWTMVWDGIIVILAGFLSTCYGKRIDLSLLGFIAMACEFLALAACTIACIFTTMAISSVAVANSKNDGAANSVQLVSLVVIESIYDLVLVINIVFIVGIVFRQSQLLCSCCSGATDAQRRGTGHFGQPVTDYIL